MIYTEAVAARIEAKIPDLAGRVKFAAEWAQVVSTNQLPQADFAAFVLPGGFFGGVADVVSGLFRQGFSQVVSVVLCKRSSGDPLGGKATDAIRPYAEAAIRAIAGWEPAPASIGVFEFAQGEIVGAMDSTTIFQLDFRLNDQLRITPS